MYIHTYITVNLFHQCQLSMTFLHSGVDYDLKSKYYVLEIKTFGLGSTIGDVFSEICSNIALCVTSGNGGCWNVGPNIF